MDASERGLTRGKRDLAALRGHHGCEKRIQDCNTANGRSKPPGRTWRTDTDRRDAAGRREGGTFFISHIENLFYRIRFKAISNHFLPARSPYSTTKPKSRNMEQRKFSERDFPALIEARRYTELLRSMEAGRDALLAFPDGRSLDSFRQTAYRENMRGDGPVCYKLKISWPQRVINVKPVTREEYEREKRSGLDT